MVFSNRVDTGTVKDVFLQSVNAIPDKPSKSRADLQTTTPHVSRQSSHTAALASDLGFECRVFFWQGANQGSNEATSQAVNVVFEHISHVLKSKEGQLLK